MKSFKQLVFLALITIIGTSFVLPAFADDALFVYVSPEGSDSGDGSVNAPYKTIEKAVSAVSEKRVGSALPARVVLRGGRYKLTETLNLISDNSNITFSAYGGESAIITAADSIEGNKFELISDRKIKERLEFNARSRVYCVNLKNLGITNIGSMQKVERHNQLDVISPPIVTVNGGMQRIAEWPNRSYTQITDYTAADGVKAFKTPENRGSRWQSADGVMAYGTSGYDSETGTYSTREWLQYGMTDGGLVRFVNILEELDSPGEWYADSSSGMLYIYPPADIKEAEVTYTASSVNLITLKNAENVSFENIIFEGTCAKAIYAENSTGLHISGCEFRSIGQVAGDIRGTDNVLVENSYFHDLGKGGIFIDAQGDKESLVSGNNVIKNCHFERFSLIGSRYCHAIRITGGVGMKVMHNRFNNSPHSAIQFSGNNHIIEYNDFYDLLHEGSDAGVIYAGRSWINGGTQIRYNYIHDIPYANIYGRAGVYLDDGMAGISVYGNVFNRANRGLSMHCAEYNNVYNNLFMDMNAHAVAIYNLDKMDNDKLNEYNGHIDWYVKQNTLRDKYTALYSKMQPLIESYIRYLDDYSNDKWKTEFPYLDSIVNDGNAIAPKGNSITNNVIYLGEGVTESKISKEGLAENPDLNNISANLELSENAVKTDGMSGNLADTSVLKTVFKDDFEGLDVSRAGIETQTSAALGGFRLLYPADNSQNVDTERFTLVWQDNSGADKYRVMVAEDKEFRNIITDEISETSHKEISALEYGKKYYWKVCAIASSDLYAGTEREKWNDGGAYSFSVMNGNRDIALNDMAFYNKEGKPLHSFDMGSINIGEFCVKNNSQEDTALTAVLENVGVSGNVISSSSYKAEVKAGEEVLFGAGVIVGNETESLRLELFSGDALCCSIAITEEMLGGSAEKNQELAETAEIYYTDQYGRAVDFSDTDEKSFIHIKVKNTADGYLPANIYFAGYVGENLDKCINSYRFIAPMSYAEVTLPLKEMRNKDFYKIFVWTEDMRACSDSVPLY